VSNDVPQFPLFDVEIDRGRDVLTVAVPEHEIRVLRAVHGPDKVRATPSADKETIALNDSADAEYARLQRKYYRINAPDPVRTAYPVGPEALAAHGFSLGRAPTEAAPAAMVKKHKQPEAAKEGKAKAKAE
jgi:hypothetical protein